MKGFHALEVSENRPIAEDAYALQLVVPPELLLEYRWQAGQHLAVAIDIDGEEQRRAFSICGPFDASGLMVTPDGTPFWPATNDGATRYLRIGYRTTGAVTRLLSTLVPMDRLRVRVPSGRFVPREQMAAGRKYLAVAAGSGITPVLALMAEAVVRGARFDLLFLNRKPASTMFAPEIDALVAQSGGRSRVCYLYSRVDGEPRPDAARIAAVLDECGQADEYFLCGPHALVTEIRGELGSRVGPSSVVHTELYAV